LLILIQMVFCTKELVNLEKNSIYISYERFKFDRSRRKRISKAGQFLRKYKLDNCRRCLMFWKVKWVCGTKAWFTRLLWFVGRGESENIELKPGLTSPQLWNIVMKRNC
jgi:lipopolysaccharide/colanic/teichoic acid biosynthesis glycosyltransferase